MIRTYAAVDGHLHQVDAGADAGRVVWFDLLSPNREEELRLQGSLGLELPSQEEMAEIEDSSRLYIENGIAFMTALLPAQVESRDPILAPVTFVLGAGPLITLRYHTPRAFDTFPQRATRAETACADGASVLLSLLDAVVDRLADLLEACGRDVERLARDVFDKGAGSPGRQHDYREVLRGVGRLGRVSTMIQDSLVTIERLTTFLGPVLDRYGIAKACRPRLKALSRDAHFLTEHAAALSGKLGFLLDATLGMISIEQNAIIKILSIAAAVFLPPTLIASIYGMNFAAMPELNSPWGYPLSVGLMVGSVLLTLWFFKSRGWL
ncbi:MAG: magnesium transporter CorA family protein [Rhodobacteraceae bacterium]|nr:magnesium transporter CorA family protein [Paracoccaceae bacterium]